LPSRSIWRISSSVAPSKTGVPAARRRAGCRQLQQGVVAEALQVLLLAAAVVDLGQEAAQLRRLALARSIASMRLPRPLAAQPRWVSSTWPTFMRDGTPSGFSTISTGSPSALNGMSSTGTTRR
jgi:hypothetical protein